jgi:preprotein translocase subunit SecE
VAVIYWVLNKPVVADFLIFAETELRRVSWPSRQEVFAATAVVVVVVVILAALLGVSDLFLQVLFDKVL